MVTVGISELEGVRKDKMTTEESMEEFKRYYDTYNEVDNLFITEASKKEYDDLDTINNNEKRFVYRKYLSDFYSNLTEEQKNFIAKFQAIYTYAHVEDKNDSEYNLKNYEELNNKFSMKGGIKWKI